MKLEIRALLDLLNGLHEVTAVTIWEEQPYAQFRLYFSDEVVTGWVNLNTGCIGICKYKYRMTAENVKLAIQEWIMQVQFDIEFERMSDHEMIMEEMTDIMEGFELWGDQMAEYVMEILINKYGRAKACKIFHDTYWEYVD